MPKLLAASILLLWAAGGLAQGTKTSCDLTKAAAGPPSQYAKLADQLVKSKGGATSAQCDSFVAIIGFVVNGKPRAAGQHKAAGPADKTKANADIMAMRRDPALLAEYTEIQKEPDATTRALAEAAFFNQYDFYSARDLRVEEIRGAGGIR